MTLRRTSTAVETVLFKTALPSISPRVKYSLQRFCDVTALLAALKCARGTRGTRPPRNKLEVWQDLKVLSFARAAAAVSSLAVVSHADAPMLTVLSRQLFQERAGSWALPGLSALSACLPRIEAQEFSSCPSRRGGSCVSGWAMVERLKTTARETRTGPRLPSSMDARARASAHSGTARARRARARSTSFVLRCTHSGESEEKRRG